MIAATLVIAQNRTLSGSVKSNEKGQEVALPGVNVIAGGTTTGAITDIDGNFTLEVPESVSNLTFSFIGYKSQTVNIGGKSTIHVMMESDVKTIDEVVVVGYGTQKKTEVTSAISSVKAEDFNKGAITSSPIQLIQGKVAGLAVSRSNGGDPTSGVQMQLRGVSTVSGTATPLVIIDGIPGGSLNTVAPEDIASIDILRDGSAAAIYGTRGTNGVILITTKKGKPGKARIEYSGYSYFDTFSNKPKVLTGDDWRQLKVDFANSTNDYLKGKVANMIDYGYSTDWFKEITQTKLSSVHNLSMSGGNEQTEYYAAVNYRDLQGLIKQSYNNFINSRLKLGHTSANKKLRVDMSFSYTSQKYRPTDYSLFYKALQRNPTLPVYNPDGTFKEETGYENFNPVALILQKDYEVQRSELLTNLRVTYELAKGLKFSNMLALQRSNQLDGMYIYRDSWQSITGGTNGEASRAERQSTDRTFESTLNYSKEFNNNHQLTALMGYTFQDFANEGFGAANRSFISDDLSYNNLGAGQSLKDGLFKDRDVWSEKNASTLIAFFGRVVYNINEKYIFSASIRREGSSKFGAANKWGTFPAVTAGWRLSKEPFMANLPFINDLKLRAGFGVTGNQGINDAQGNPLNYVSLERLTASTSLVYFNGKWVPSYVAASNPNRDLRWEKKSETNVGLDIGLFQNLVTATLDVYQRSTSDLIYNYPVPVPPNRYDNTWLNVGTMRNRGIELTINAVVLEKRAFKWNTNFNISYNQNVLKSLSNDLYTTKRKEIGNLDGPGLYDIRAYLLEEGQPIGNMYGYAFAGFKDDGTWQFWDKTDTKKLSAKEITPEDKRVIGNGLPKYWMGFTNTFSYKNFDFSALIRGTFGFNILNNTRLYYGNQSIIPSNVLKSAISDRVIESPVFSDYYVETGSYLRIDNATLGYTIPIENKFMLKARIYASVRNLATFTKYSGQDPELAILGLTPGMDNRSTYPATRTMTVGVNIQF